MATRIKNQCCQKDIAIHFTNCFLVEFLLTNSAYSLYGKPGKNSNGTVHPVEIFWKKSNTSRGITVYPFLPKRPKFSVPFVWITSTWFHVERKRKIYRYFVNGTTQSRSCFRCQKKYQYHLTEIFHRNFRTNCKRSKTQIVPSIN